MGKQYMQTGRNRGWKVLAAILAAALVLLVLIVVIGAQDQAQCGVQVLTSGVSTSAVPMAVFNDIGACQGYGDQQLAAGAGDTAVIYETWGGDTSIINKPIRWLKTAVDFTYGGQFRQWTRVGN